MHGLRYLNGILVLVAALVAGGWLWRALGEAPANQGFQVTVEFADARGLRGGADVRCRGVRVGTVLAVAVSKDGNRAVTRMLLQPDAVHLARVDTVFWIVTPRFEGLGSGVSGLDTLVRDAYVALLSPPDGAVAGTQLESGAVVAGVDQPPEFARTIAMDPVQAGDLLMELLLPENHGLQAGSSVQYRGMKVGEVRSLALAADGSHVVATLRVHRSERATVTERSTFWVARPTVTGALWSGFSLADLSSLLSPHVSYHARPGSGLPVEDGWRTIAAANRPDVEVEAVPDSALAPRQAVAPAAASKLHLVRISYSAIEHDFWTPDDAIQREGNGILWVDRAGRAVVATTRSCADAVYTEGELFGRAPDIRSEQTKVLLTDGRVVRAGRVWVAPTGEDLCLLVLEGAAEQLAGTPPALLGFDDAKPEANRYYERAGAEPVLFQADLVLDAKEPWVGASIRSGEVVHGLLGQQGPRSRTGAVVPLHLVPADLRPAP